jgi:hypothetical protein
VPDPSVAITAAPAPRPPEAVRLSISARHHVPLASVALDQCRVVLLVEGQMIDPLAASPRDVALDPRVIGEREVFLDLRRSGANEEEVGPFAEFFVVEPV